MLSRVRFMLNSLGQVVVSDADRTQRPSLGPTVISSKLGRVPTGLSSITYVQRFHHHQLRSSGGVVLSLLGFQTESRLEILVMSVSNHHHLIIISSR